MDATLVDITVPAGVPLPEALRRVGAALARRLGYEPGLKMQASRVMAVFRGLSRRDGLAVWTYEIRSRG